MTATEEKAHRLHPYPSYKDSGVEWIGQIPEGWEVSRLKQHARAVNARTETRPSELPYLGLEHIESGTGRLTNLPEPVQIESMVGLFDSGDILFGKLRPYLAKVYMANASGCSSTEITAFRPIINLEASFLKYWLISDGHIKTANMLTFGSKMPRVSPEQLLNIYLPIPSLEEQQAIAAFLDRETARIDELMREQEALLDDLSDKRQATITQAVTKGLDPNVNMKPSGVEWIGEIPAQWIPLPLKQGLSQIVMGGTPNTDDGALWDDEGTPWVTIGDMTRQSRLKTTNRSLSQLGLDSKKLRSLPIGTVLYSIYASLGKVAVLEVPAVTNQAILALIPKEDVNPDFLRYWLNGLEPHVVANANTNTQSNLNQSKVRNLPFVKPSEREQQAIAAYLDEQLAQIDELREEVRANIEDMRIHRSALITAAVTGKIDVRPEAE